MCSTHKWPLLNVLKITRLNEPNGANQTSVQKDYDYFNRPCIGQVLKSTVAAQYKDIKSQTFVSPPHEKRAYHEPQVVNLWYLVVLTTSSTVSHFPHPILWQEDQWLKKTTIWDLPPSQLASEVSVHAWPETHRLSFTRGPCQSPL